MCIAILKPAGRTIDKEVLKRCYIANDDGCGFAFNNKGKLFIFKHMEFEPFYAKYREAQDKYPESTFVIHFRIGTSGEKSEFNCHPFIINKNQVFIHNGVINKVPSDPDKKMNDTQMFNKLFLQKLPTGWETNEAIISLIDSYIGASKLVILNSDGSYIFVNENMGHWNDGIWWSNNSYKPVIETFRDHKGYFTRQPDYRTNNIPNFNNNNNNNNKTIVKFERQHKKLHVIKNNETLRMAAWGSNDIDNCTMCDKVELDYLLVDLVLHGVEHRMCLDCVNDIESLNWVFHEKEINLQKIHERYQNNTQNDMRFLQ